MSTKNHLKRIVKRLRECFDHEILDADDWTYNLKHWTIQFYYGRDVHSVIAYKVKDNVTQWDNYIIVERFRCEWIREV